MSKPLRPRPSAPVILRVRTSAFGEGTRHCWTPISSQGAAVKKKLQQSQMKDVVVFFDDFFALLFCSLPFLDHSTCEIKGNIHAVVLLFAIKRPFGKRGETHFNPRFRTWNVTNVWLTFERHRKRFIAFSLWYISKCPLPANNLSSVASIYVRKSHISFRYRQSWRKYFVLKTQKTQASFSLAIHKNYIFSTQNWQ